MGKIPTYDSQQGLNPTLVNSEIASSGARNLIDVGKGLEGLGEHLVKLQNRTETLKAETYLSQAHRDIYKTAVTDPDVFNVEEKVQQASDKNIETAGAMIKDQNARNEFIAKAKLDTERRNVPIYNAIYRRQSQDYKGEIIKANDEDIKDYQLLKDPAERALLKKRIEKRTIQGIDQGYIHGGWGRKYLDHTLTAADLDQVKSDMSIDAEGAYRELQKGKDGLYPDISPTARKHFVDQAQRLIKKQGTESNMIYAIAQNSAENVLLDKMQANALTQDDINNSQLVGINGIKVRPEFAKAANEALMDPYPTMPAFDKYNELVTRVLDPDVDPLQAKIDVLSARGITNTQKAHLLNAALREDPSGDGKQNLEQLVASGIARNKQQILDANLAMRRNVDSKKTLLGQIQNMFKDHAKDDVHQAELMQDFMAKAAQARKTDDMLQISKQIINRDTVMRNPRIATADPNGTIFINKITGETKRFFPDGHSEPIGNAK